MNPKTNLIFSLETLISFQIQHVLYFVQWMSSLKAVWKMNFFNQIPFFRKEASCVRESSGDLFWKTNDFLVNASLFFFFSVNFCNWCLFKVGQAKIGFPRVYFILPFLNFMRYFQTVKCSWDTYLCSRNFTKLDFFSNPWAQTLCPSYQTITEYRSQQRALHAVFFPEHSLPNAL